MSLASIRAQRKNKKSKRVGRGSGSGHGKTSCRGHKGAGQRKGTKHYIGFEGGNVPFLRKIPKYGFRPKRPKQFQIVNLDHIQSRLKGKKEINPQELKAVNLIKDESRPVKILAKMNDKLTLAVTFKAHKFSKKAVKIIKEAGGSVECLTQ